MFKKRLIYVFLGVILGVFLLDAILINGLPAIQLGQFSIYILDIVSVFLLSLILIKLIQTRFQIQKIMILPLIIGGLLAITYLRGLIIFGIEGATNALRSYLYFYATFMATLILFEDDQSVKPVISSWVIAAWILFGLVIIRWGMVALGLVSRSSWNAAGGLMMRVINASQTLVLFQALIFSVTINERSKFNYVYRLIPFLFIPTIILLQHRTIWIIFAVCLILFLFLDKKIRMWPYVWGALIALVLISGIVLAIFWGNPTLMSFIKSAQNLANFGWRVEGWTQLLSPERFQSNLDYIIGQPFGTGYDRILTGAGGHPYLVSVSPHNFYVQTFLNIGIIGLVVLVIIYFLALRSLIKTKHTPFAIAFALILISQLIYFITYAPNYEQGVLLGVAMLLSKKKVTYEDHRGLDSSQPKS